MGLTDGDDAAVMTAVTSKGALFVALSSLFETLVVVAVISHL